MALTVYSQLILDQNKWREKNLSQLLIRPEKTSYETLRNRDTILRLSCLFTFFYLFVFANV